MAVAAPLKPSLNLDSASAKTLLRHWPNDLDPRLLLDPRSTLKLALYEQINQKLMEWKDPGLPPYRPGPSHWPAILGNNRFVLIAGGERGGKSRFAAQEMVARATQRRLEGHRQARYWFAAHKYRLTEVEFNATQELFRALGALPDHLPKTNAYVRKPQDHSWSMRLGGDWEGIEIETATVDDPTNIAAVPLDGVVICEAALCDHEVWLKFRARVAERLGFVILTGTHERARGQWYKQLQLQWQNPGQEGVSYSFPTWENFEIFPGGWADPEIIRIREGVDEDWFMERFAGVPVKPTSLVFRQFEPHVHVQEAVQFRPQRTRYIWRGDPPALEPRELELREDWPVELAVDPGNADYAILAIQRTTDRHGRPLVYVIDEVFGRNEDTAGLIEKCRRRPWWGAIERQYPGVIDVAAKQRTGGIPVQRVWREVSGLNLRARKVMVDDGINKLRAFLSDFAAKAAMDGEGKPLYPRQRDWARLFVSPRCRRLIEEFQLMRFPSSQDPTEWRDPERGYDHGIKALWYFLVDRYPQMGRETRAEGYGVLKFG